VEAEAKKIRIAKTKRRRSQRGTRRE